MQKLDLSHAGKFTERAEALLKAILDANGAGEFGAGIGLLPDGDQIGILVSFDEIATVFLPREARALVEIITEANKEEAPYSRAVGRVLDHLISDLTSLAEEAEHAERTMVLNETRH